MNVLPAPANHLGAAPDYCLTNPSHWRIAIARRHPTIAGGAISAATDQIGIGASVTSSPYSHFTAGPNRGVTGAVSRRIRGTRGGPTVSGGIISASDCFAPRNHLAPGPNCSRVRVGCVRCVDAGANVLTGVVSAAVLYNH